MYRRVLVKQLCRPVSPYFWSSLLEITNKTKSLFQLLLGLDLQLEPDLMLRIIELN